MSDQDLIAAFLARKSVTVVADAAAYGVDPKADKEKRAATRASAQRSATAQPERRNWAAQARYDEEHGTINGYAPWQYTQEM